MLFFIDLEKETDKRFDISKFFEFTDNYDPLSSGFVSSLKSISMGGLYTITKEDGRPDLISNNIYGDTQYWWILMLYNDYVIVEDFKIGEQIKYPSLTELEDLYFSLKVKQLAVNGA